MSKLSALGALLAFVCILPLGCEAIVGDTSYRNDAGGGGGGGIAGRSQGGAGESATGGATSTAGTGGAGMTGDSGGEAGAGGMAAASGVGTDGGAAGETCLPVIDGNPCTEDVCVNGVPKNPASAVGAPCENSEGGTRCDGHGACVMCLDASDCPGTDGACQTRTCTQGACGFDFATAGTALPAQTAGDCKKAVCDGHGTSTLINDDADLPNDSNACTSDVCTGGLPSNSKQPAGTACGTSLLCNESGVCVGCNAPSDCPGSDTECKTRTCVSNSCGVAFTAAGTAVAAQTAGNCLKATCDGAGNVTSIADATDVPSDDGNACTNETCASGVPQHPAKTNGTACTDGNPCTVADTCQSGACTSGAPLVCSALDQCHTAGTCNTSTGACSNPLKAPDSACSFAGGSVCSAAGACVQCNAAAQCPGSDGECANRTCVGNVCGVNNVPAGQATSVQTAGDCHKNQCDGSGNIVAGIDDTDLPTDDGSQCTGETCNAGVASHPAGPINLACNQAGGSFCSASGTCVQCNAASQCPGADTECSARTCSSNTCGVANTPAGTATSAQAAGDCHTSQCDGAGNVVSSVDDLDIPADDGNQCTEEVCSGGVASHPNSPPNKACNQMGGTTCDGSGNCL